MQQHTNQGHRSKPSPDNQSSGSRNPYDAATVPSSNRPELALNGENIDQRGDDQLYHPRWKELGAGGFTNSPFGEVAKAQLELLEYLIKKSDLSLQDLLALRVRDLKITEQDGKHILAVQVDDDRLIKIDNHTLNLNIGRAINSFRFRIEAKEKVPQKKSKGGGKDTKESKKVQYRYKEPHMREFLMEDAPLFSTICDMSEWDRQKKNKTKEVGAHDRDALLKAQDTFLSYLIKPERGEGVSLSSLQGIRYNHLRLEMTRASITNPEAPYSPLIAIEETATIEAANDMVRAREKFCDTMSLIGNVSDALFLRRDGSALFGDLGKIQEQLKRRFKVDTPPRDYLFL